MALTKCKECNAEVSDKAQACPKCGAPIPPPRKKTGLFSWLVVGVLAAGFVSALTSNSPPPPAAEAPPAKVELTAEQKQAESDRMNAGALLLTVKQHAKDPDSFKLHSAFVTTTGTGCIEYSATNSFNARLRGIAVATRGKTTISEDSATWNKLCVQKEGTDYTDLFQRTILQ